jgi:uncharacterized circularly permuted ATP-grasp superfamily protein
MFWRCMVFVGFDLGCEGVGEVTVQCGVVCVLSRPGSGQGEEVDLYFLVPDIRSRYELEVKTLALLHSSLTFSYPGLHNSPTG